MGRVSVPLRVFTAFPRARVRRCSRRRDVSVPLRVFTAFPRDWEAKIVIDGRFSTPKGLHCISTSIHDLQARFGLPGFSTPKGLHCISTPQQPGRSGPARVSVPLRVFTAFPHFDNMVAWSFHPDKVSVPLRVFTAFPPRLLGKEAIKRAILEPAMGHGANRLASMTHRSTKSAICERLDPPKLTGVARNFAK